MTGAQTIALIVLVQRLIEMVYAGRNARRLRARGGIEIGARHYPLFFLLHGAWLAAIAFLVPAAAPLNVPLLVLFVVLQATRLWVIASLGPYWTTRVITMPDAPLIRTGPYRWCRHPNYAVVALEIATLPLVFGAWGIAVVFSVLNALLLWHRIQVENQALAARR